MLLKASTVLGAIAALPLAACARSPTPISRAPSARDEDACASIGELAESLRSSSGGMAGIPAKLAYDCLTATPLNKNLASEFIEKFKPYLEFHSTLAYLKDPPDTYKMPSVDLMGGLDDIADQVQDGTLKSQYDLDAALLKLTTAAHDGHLIIYLGTIGVFTFELPISLVSVSEDGKKLPEIFVLDDVYLSQSGDANVSPIDQIDGQDAVDWLKDFATQFSAAGVVEDHADFNGLMHNRARAVSAGVEFPSALNLQYLYPGETFEGTFKNGSSFSYDFTASTTVDFAGVSSASEFYNGYVLSDPGTVTSPSPGPPDDDTPTASVSLLPTPSPLLSVGEPYPGNPIVKQLDWYGQVEAFGVTGYLLEEESIGVLCIPSFMAGTSSDSWLDFSETVQRFLTKCKNADIQKIVVDLQGNGGGISFLGLDLFKQFFPETEPYAGGRFRTHEAGRVLGDIFTSMARDPYEDPYLYSWSPWDEERWTDEDGQDFADWDALFEPLDIHGDTFTQVLRENLTHAYVDEESFPITVFGYGSRATSDPQPYAAEDIVLLQDGFCGSTCVIFSDMMRIHHGVKTVAVGGLPEEGPMQGAAGTRGGLVYDFQAMARDIETATDKDSSAAKSLPSLNLPYNLGGGGVNLRDQLHEGDDTPLQFLYEPSNCRIWYTPEMIVDYTHLWKAAAYAIWDDASDLCIKDSVIEGPEGQDEESSSTDDEDGEEDGAASVTLSCALVVAVSLFSTAFIVM